MAFSAGSAPVLAEMPLAGDDAGMSDEAVPTVLDRLLRAGISREGIDAHHASSLIRIDGEIVSDLNQPAAPPPGRIWIAGA